jgi:aminopeptidase N
MKKIIYSLFVACFAIAFILQSNVAYSQHAKMQFSYQDSLRGGLRKERAYNVKYYDLNLKIDISTQSISGFNKITFQNIDLDSVLQLDLFENFEIDSIVYQIKNTTQTLRNRREGKVIWVELPTEIRNSLNYKLDTSKENKTNEIITVFYHGKPRNAVNPPWDGGFTWNKKANEKPWVTVSCQGLGASSWFPLKDHLSDKPDSVRMYFEVPKDLFCVSNGDLISINKDTKNKEYIGYEWKTSHPIASYNMTLNVGDYAHFEDEYVSNIKRTNPINRVSKQDSLTSIKLDYYVIKGNEKKAKPYFKSQVKPMLEAFEYYFGEYPFEKDGYALVETPYWGMEHQSCVAYGNNYKLNPFGFDFIIIHESGHEFFGNSISANDNAELWIHESFTTYSEALFVEYFQGKEKAIDYLETQKTKIINQDVILAPLDVNYDNWLGADMYYKGSWMLHSLRSVVDNDVLWFATIKDFYQTHKHSHINTEQVINFFNQETGKNLSPIFNFYLTNKEIPVLEYEILEEDDKVFLSYYWKVNKEEGNNKNIDFNMPIEVFLGGKDEEEKESFVLNATTTIQKLDISDKINKKDNKKIEEIELIINERKYLANILKK